MSCSCSRIMFPSWSSCCIIWPPCCSPSWGCCPCCRFSSIDLQLGEQLLGGIARPGQRQLFDAVEHRLQILGPQRLHVGARRQVGDLLVAAGLVEEGLHVALHRVAQFLREPFDLLVGRIVFQRLPQGLLGGAQILRRARQFAVLDAERDRPEVVDHVAQVVVVAGVGEPVVRAAQRRDRCRCPRSSRAPG